MKNQLLICLSLVCLSSMAIASENLLKNNKQVVLILAQNGMDSDLYHNILQRVTEIAVNQVKLKELSLVSLTRNVDLIIELEEIVNDNVQAISPSTKLTILDFTQQVRSNYRDMIRNSK